MEYINSSDVICYFLDPMNKMRWILIDVLRIMSWSILGLPKGFEPVSQVHQWCHVLFLSYGSHGRYHGFNGFFFKLFFDMMSLSVKMKGFLQIKCRSNTMGLLSINLPRIACSISILIGQSRLLCFQSKSAQCAKTCLNLPYRFPSLLCFLFESTLLIQGAIFFAIRLLET